MFLILISTTRFVCSHHNTQTTWSKYIPKVSDFYVKMGIHVITNQAPNKKQTRGYEEPDSITWKELNYAPKLYVQQQTFYIHWPSYVLTPLDQLKRIHTIIVYNHFNVLNFLYKRACFDYGRSNLTKNHIVVATTHQLSTRQLGWVIRNE